MASPGGSLRQHVIDADTHRVGHDATVRSGHRGLHPLRGSPKRQTRRLEACGIIPQLWCGPRMILMASSIWRHSLACSASPLLSHARAFWAAWHGRGAVPLEHLPCDHVKLRLSIMSLSRFPISFAFGAPAGIDRLDPPQSSSNPPCPGLVPLRPHKFLLPSARKPMTSRRPVTPTSRRPMDRGSAPAHARNSRQRIRANARAR